MHRGQIDDFISARSYAIWEREGRGPGKPEEYWDRARQEIEEEIRAALAGEKGFVLPHLGISQRPIRYEAEEISKAA